MVVFVKEGKDHYDSDFRVKFGLVVIMKFNSMHYYCFLVCLEAFNGELQFDSDFMRAKVVSLIIFSDVLRVFTLFISYFRVTL